MIPVDEAAIGVLGELELLDGLDGEGKRRLVESFWMDDFPAGRAVLDEGDTNTRLYAVIDGALAVKLSAKRARTETVTLTRLEPGRMFGEFSLYDGLPVSASVVAERPSRVAWIEKSAIDAFVEGHPSAGRVMYDNLVRNLIGRLREHNARAELATIG